MMQRTRVGMAIAGIAIIASGCTHSADGSSGTTTQPSAMTTPAPDPDLSQSLHGDYRVVEVTKLRLSGGPTDERVVISSGPGLDPNSPVEGGTEDVQVLSYDPLAKRWNVAFDAASKTTSDGANGATSLLPQADRVGTVAARPVQLATAAPADLLITGVDSTTNHPTTVIGIVRFGGSATLSYADHSATNADIRIDGPSQGPQTVAVTSDYFTYADPACCPLRKFTQSIGLKGQAGVVGVLADDRPWLGAWITGPFARDYPAGTGVVVSTVNGSPASAVLQVGDIVTGVQGAQSATSNGVRVYDEIGALKAGTKVLLDVQRDEKKETLSVTLGSRADDTASFLEPPRAASIGVGAFTSSQPPGVTIVNVTASSPADRAGLTRGSIITAVGDLHVRNTTDLVAGLTGSAGSVVALTVFNPATGQASSVGITPVTTPGSTWSIGAI